MSRYDPYQPLRQYLVALPAHQRTSTLTFAELEAMRGERLALAARVDYVYWSGSPVARHNWQALGWTAKLDRHARTVTFTRSTP